MLVSHSDTMNLRQSQEQWEQTLRKLLNSAEEAHRMTAAGVFDQLGQIAPLSGIVHGVRPLYDEAATHIFALSRDLNRNAGEFARALLDRMGM